MYKTSVPIMNHLCTDENREVYLCDVKEGRIDRVFLCPSVFYDSDEEYNKTLASLCDNIAFFKANGVEAGVWISTFGHGGRLTHETKSAARSYTPIKGLYSGKDAIDSYCPLDEGFASYIRRYVADLAATGTDLIMLDDDYRFASRSCGIGCACKLHMKKYIERLGRDITREELAQKVFFGGENEYRDIWLRLMGDTLTEYAKELRAAVDKVNAKVRLGVCSVFSMYDLDGTDAVEISRAFAGGTKPFMRLFGAPYALNPKLHNMIEMERMEASWCGGSGVELFSEGDVYPRPRYRVPSCYLECFDTALAASGGTDGILKYMFDYTSSPYYERGYLERHIRNLPLKGEILRMFGGKDDCGVCVYETAHRIKKARLPETEYAGDGFLTCLMQPFASRLLSTNSIPTKYSGGGAGIAFGENALYLDENALSGGLILDAPAAALLSEKGVDTGFVDMCKTDSPQTELFGNERVCLAGGGQYFKVTVKPGAEILSEFNGDTVFPACYRYENAKGQRFVVYAFDGYDIPQLCAVTSSYARQKQLIESVEWLQRGNSLPAVCTGNPYLYMIVKRDGDKMSVGMWNLFEDTVFTPEITLDREYSTVRFLNCEGGLKGSVVRLTTDIAPYGMAFFEVGCLP